MKVVKRWGITTTPIEKIEGLSGFGIRTHLKRRVGQGTIRVLDVDCGSQATALTQLKRKFGDRIITTAINETPIKSNGVDRKFRKICSTIGKQDVIFTHLGRTVHGAGFGVIKRMLSSLAPNGICVIDIRGKTMVEFRAIQEIVKGHNCRIIKRTTHQLMRKDAMSQRKRLGIKIQELPPLSIVVKRVK